MKTERDLGKLLNKAQLVSTSMRLIQLGARTTLVQHLTGMKILKVRDLYHEMGIQPTGGPAVSNPLFFTKLSHRAEGIHFYSVIIRLLSKHKMTVSNYPASLFLDAYDRYTQNNTSEHVLDVNRAWFLLQSLENKTIQAVHCNCCHGLHLLIEGDFATHSTICVWCELNQYRHCSHCGQRHRDRHPGIALTHRLCKECRNERRNEKTSEKFVQIHEVYLG